MKAGGSEEIVRDLLRSHWSPLCWSKCFLGLEEVEGKCGTKFLVDINLLPLGGPRKLGRSKRGGHTVDITPQQSRSVCMSGPNGLHA